MDKVEARAKAQLIKDALTIVDELADVEYDDYAELSELVDRAQKLKKNRWWKLT